MNYMHAAMLAYSVVAWLDLTVHLFFGMKPSSTEIFVSTGRTVFWLGGLVGVAILLGEYVFKGI